MEAVQLTAELNFVIELDPDLRLKRIKLSINFYRFDTGRCATQFIGELSCGLNTANHLYFIVHNPIHLQGIRLMPDCIEAHRFVKRHSGCIACGNGEHNLTQKHKIRDRRTPLVPAHIAPSVCEACNSSNKSRAWGIRMATNGKIAG